MVDEDATSAAIAQFNGQEYDGRNIVVNEARPREDRSRSGGGRGRDNRNNYDAGGGYGAGNRW